MTELLFRIVCGATLGLALVLLLRRPTRRAFGAGPAFTLWLLPIALMLAPLLPPHLMPTAMVVLPDLTVTPHVVTTAASPAITVDWTQGLMAVWLSGVAFGLLRLAFHYFKLLRGLRAPSAAWDRMLAEAESKLDTRRVRMHDAGPAVLWALPRALILLPADFSDRFENAATRALVLRHELSHARRGDAWWTLTMEIASALLWFHPLVWIARPRFRLDQELACDAASLRASPECKASYAQALFDSVATRPLPALIPWLAEPQLKERILLIMRVPPGALRHRGGLLTIATLLAVSVYVAGAQMPVHAQTSVASTPPTVYFMYKDRNPPHYPVDAIHKGEQGMVILDVAVDASGNVAGVRVDQHGTNAAASLQVAAMDAAKKWKFNPGRKSGKPVSGTMRIPVRFSLPELNKDQGEAKPCPIGDIYDSRVSKCMKVRTVQTSS